MKRFLRPQSSPKQHRTTGKKLSRTRKNGSQLGYDALEPRLALTAFIVNSAIDDATGTEDGLISLREAIIAANTNAAFGDAPAGEETGDTIQFSIAGQNMRLDAGEIAITDDLQILGMSSNNTIDGNGGRIFSISSNESVAIARITLSDGRADQGGAINSTGFGSRILVGVTFDNNTATGTGGGAVYSETGNIFVTDSNFSNNRATSGRGGAFYLNSGRLSVTRGEMISNSASLTGGAIEVNGGEVIMNDAQIGRVGQGNTAGLGNSNGRGGGLHVAASAANVYVNGGEFNSNTASREGGGLWNQTDATMLIQSNARIINNIASGDAVDDGGGGIFNNGGYLVVNNSTVSLNLANGTLGSGGGIFSTADDVLITGSTVASNQANRAGGGVEIINGSVFVVNSTLGGSSAFFGNTAGPTGSSTTGDGGGLHISGSASVYVLGTRVENNVAASEGGGLWNASSSLLRLDNASEIFSNTANGAGSSQGGGGIFNNGGRLTIGNSLINGNRAGGSSGSGGGILSTDGTVLVFSSTLNGNAAARAGGGIEIIDGFMNLASVNVTGNNVGTTFTGTPGDGGGLHISGFSRTRVVVDGGMFANNSASNDGGGLWNQAQSTLFLKGSVQIDNNSAGNFGGGVYNRGHLEATDAFFTNNGANQGGGFHNAPSGTASTLNVDFINNDADTLGGGIYNNNILNIEDAIVSLNDAATDGGGIYTLAVARTNQTNVTFSGNTPNDTN